MDPRIEIIKDLRKKGATIRMIDDVAAYVGGYESPVFVATVEFIIKIRNMLQSVNLSKEQEMGISEQLIGAAMKETQNVSFTAAKTAVSNDEELPEDERKRIIAHISAVEKEVELQTQPEETKKKTLLGRNKKSREGKKSSENSILKRLFNISALADTARRNNQRLKQMQQDQDEQEHEAATRASRQQQRQVVQRTAQRRNSLRQQLLNIWHIAVEKQHGAEAHAHHEAPRETAKVHKESGRAKEASKEIGISKLIDNLVKESKEAKQPVEKIAQTEKGQFAAKVAENQGPKANEANVAQMQAETAIKNLQSGGVRLSNTEVQKMQTEKVANANTKERGLA